MQGAEVVGDPTELSRATRECVTVARILSKRIPTVEAGALQAQLLGQASWLGIRENGPQTAARAKVRSTQEIQRKPGETA